jgi:hypothetical protein
MLWRITPQAGSRGTLGIDAIPGAVTVDIYGGIAGGEPFLFGAAAGQAPVPPLFLGALGVLDLDPLHSLYLPVLDGPGLFGTPDPLAVIPAGGHFQVTFAVSAQASGLSVKTQAVIVGAGAPNGLSWISNVVALVLP